MGIIYLAALIVGFGTIALQLFMSGDHAAPGADVDTGGVDVHAGDADAASQTHSGDVHTHGDILPVFLSLRFWTFALLAFGL